MKWPTIKYVLDRTGEVTEVPMYECPRADIARAARGELPDRGDGYGPIRRIIAQYYLRGVI